MYQLFQKRTLPPMTIFAGTIFIVFVGTVIFYKDLTNKALSGQKKDTEMVVEATNRVYLGKQVNNYLYTFTRISHILIICNAETEI